MDVSREIAAPIDLAWELVAQTRHWAHWGPSVAAVEPADAVVAPGLAGRLRTPVGVWIPFEISEVVAEGPRRHWSWRVGGISATGHRVEAVTPTRSRVTFEVPGLAAPYAMVCRIALGRLANLAAGQGG